MVISFAITNDIKRLLREVKMDYIGIDEVAKKWGLSKRFVQVLCANGRIEGRAWMIPKNAEKPIDGRTKAARSKYDADMPLPRKTPFLYMSDLYHTPEQPTRLVKAFPTITKRVCSSKPRSHTLGAR